MCYGTSDAETWPGGWGGQRGPWLWTAFPHASLRHCARFLHPRQEKPPRFDFTWVVGAPVSCGCEAPVFSRPRRDCGATSTLRRPAPCRLNQRECQYAASLSSTLLYLCICLLATNAVGFVLGRMLRPQPASAAGSPAIAFVGTQSLCSRTDRLAVRARYTRKVVRSQPSRICACSATNPAINRTINFGPVTADHLSISLTLGFLLLRLVLVHRQVGAEPRKFSGNFHAGAVGTTSAKVAPPLLSTITTAPGNRSPYIYCTTASVKLQTDLR